MGKNSIRSKAVGLHQWQFKTAFVNSNNSIELFSQLRGKTGANRESDYKRCLKLNKGSDQPGLHAERAHKEKNDRTREC